MLIEIIIPKLYEDMENGLLLEWIKKENEYIEVGDILFTLETEKAAFEIEAEAEGNLKKILTEDLTEVKVLEVVGYIEGPDI
jgi:pyruvate dehydrogenase E2 component (dihydrolipoamide acetyltransferase)